MPDSLFSGWGSPISYLHTDGPWEEGVEGLIVEAHAFSCEAYIQHLGRIKYPVQDKESGFQTLCREENDFKRLVT